MKTRTPQTCHEMSCARRYLPLVVLWFGVLIVVPHVFADGPGLSNGGFEAPQLPGGMITESFTQGSTSLTGWTIGGNGGPVLLVDSWPGTFTSYEGKQWIAFNAGNTAPGTSVSQTFSTIAGQSYTASFAVGSDGFGNVGLTASALASGGATLAATNFVPANDVWQTFQLSFVATTANTTLMFLDTSPSTGGADVLLDDVSVVSNAPPVVNSEFVNGGFETPQLPGGSTTESLTQGSTNLTGWTIGGNGGPVLLVDSWPGTFTSYEGKQWIAFNAGNSVPGTSVSQTFSTIAGQSYTASFAVGSDGFGNVGLTASALASGGATLAATNCVPASGAWNLFQLNFVATTASTTLKFLDTSASTDGGDVTLDDVSVVSNAPPVVNSEFINGGFETPQLPGGMITESLAQGSTNLTGWTIGGNGGPVLLVGSWPGGIFTSYEGKQWIAFNAGETAPGSSVSQTFSTIAGQSYTASFAVGSDGFGNVGLTASALASGGATLAATNCVPANDVWQTFQLSFVATTSNTTLMFLDTSPSTDSADVVLDDVQVLNSSTAKSIVQVLNATATGGATATISIDLNAVGTENAAGFSLNFDTHLMTYSGAVLGHDASGGFLVVNPNETNAGNLGFAVALPNGTFHAGTNDLINVTFVLAPVATPTTASLTFGNTPTIEQVADVLANVLPATFSGGSITIQSAGLEGDVAPRPNGDGTLTVADWVQEGRFIVGLDVASNGTEFQRADCAPRGTLGDGQITVADWVQVARYVAGLDPITAAGGPDAPVPGNITMPAIKDDSAVSKISIVPLEVSHSVAIALVGNGSESAVQFSIRFDATLIRFAAARLGAGASGAVLLQNTNAASSGELGFVVGLPTPGTFARGAQQLVEIDFSPLSYSTDIAMAFDDKPVVRQLVDYDARIRTASYEATVLSAKSFTWPLLSISRIASDRVLSWPSDADGFDLEYAPVLGGNWSVVSDSAVTNGSAVSLTIPLTNSGGYYRLHHR